MTNRVFTFGKYRGHTVQSVVYADPGYALWAHNTVSWFRLDAIELIMAADNNASRPPRRRYRRRVLPSQIRETAQRVARW